MKKKLGVIISSLALVVALAACNVMEETEKEKEVTHEEQTHEEIKTEPVVEVEKDLLEETKTIANVETEAQPVLSTPSPTQSEPVKETVTAFIVTSGEQAVDYLKGQIPEGDNEDVIFGATPELETDEKGSYYFVRLSSLSLRLAGGTGTIDTYKVYQDGTYETTY